MYVRNLRSSHFLIIPSVGFTITILNFLHFFFWRKGAGDLCLFFFLLEVKSVFSGPRR